MRVVEPGKYTHTEKQRRRPRLAVVLVVLAVVVLFGGGSLVFTLDRLKRNADSEEGHVDTTLLVEFEEEAESPAVEPDTVPPTPVESPVETTPQLRIFADNDFKIFYDQLLQPNLLPLENPPEISGNVTADARIRKIAEDRGYRLRSSPSVTLSSVDGYSVQAPVVQAWQNLKAAAAAQGHSMSIVSAYRTVERQRTLFLSRLAATGATIQQVADGLADDKVDSVLVTSSIPGYSKHHTGYTIDILCAGWAFENFKNSPCNAWITADNYKVAKENGFIPSYPENADLQGPDPEAWEYVWVGTEHLYE